MPSRALESWKKGASAKQLDELYGAHSLVGGTRRGRRYATRELNGAIVLQVSAHFQLFCRDLHSEAADALVDAAPHGFQPLLRAYFGERRGLDARNPQPDVIEKDFSRFGLSIWDESAARDKDTIRRRERLEQLNIWRNAVAHQDFAFNSHQSQKIAGTDLTLAWARRWRSSCSGLAITFDAAVAQHVLTVTGTRPW